MSELCQVYRTATGVRCGGNKLALRSSPQPGNWPRRTDSPGLLCATWATWSTCEPSRSTPTSIPSSRSTTRCSSRAIKSSPSASIRTWGGLDAAGNPSEFFRQAAQRYFEFCTQDPVRFQLLFQRTIPGFEPSPASWQVALDAFEAMRQSFHAAGITAHEAVDLWTALLTGLVDQQISNDPGGARWQRLLDEAVDMYLSHFKIPNRATARK